jgi:2'-5' RNA ligase
VRLFFAVFPDAEPRHRLWQAARALSASPGWKMLSADQYHMTVLFLGGVRESDVPAVREVGGAQRGGIIPLRFDRWQHFEESRVVVAATSDLPEALAHLRAGLAGALAARGIEFDDQPLHPHITVARKVAQAPVPQALSEIVWTARSFSLVASARGPAGSVYTVIDTWPLLDVPPVG